MFSLFICFHKFFVCFPMFLFTVYFSLLVPAGDRSLDLRTTHLFSVWCRPLTVCCLLFYCCFVVAVVVLLLFCCFVVVVVVCCWSFCCWLLFSVWCRPMAVSCLLVYLFVCLFVYFCLIGYGMGFKCTSCGTNTSKVWFSLCFRCYEGPIFSSFLFVLSNLLSKLIVLYSAYNKNCFEVV